LGGEIEKGRKKDLLNRDQLRITRSVKSRGYSTFVVGGHTKELKKRDAEKKQEVLGRKREVFL